MYRKHESWQFEIRFDCELIYWQHGLMPSMFLQNLIKAGMQNANLVAGLRKSNPISYVDKKHAYHKREIKCRVEYFSTFI